MDLGEILMRHKRTIFSGAAVAMLISVAACHSQQKTSNAVQQTGTTSRHAVSVAWSGTTRSEVKDPAYGTTAITINTPIGWKFVGTILRPAGCHPPAFPAAGLSYTALSPDGITAFEMLPGSTWSWTSNGYNVTGPKCPSNMNIDTADAFLLNIAIPNLHPDAKVVAVLPNPQSTQDWLAQRNQEGTAQLRQYGLRGRAITDYGRVRIAYERNGQPVEEIVGTGISCQEVQMAMPMQRPYTQRTCNSTGTSIVRAPRGYLDSLKRIPPPELNNDWNSRVIQDMKTQFQQFQAASNRQFQALHQQMEDNTRQILHNGQRFNQQLRSTAQSAMRADAAQQSAIDDAAHQASLHALDRQTFINPGTGQKIEASSEYNHQWISSDNNTLIQTQDPTFDPNGSVYPISQSWTELVPQ